MAFSTGDSEGPKSDINVTPLVDVMLVLLIIFMITAPLMSHKVKVELPQANLDDKDTTVPPAVPITIAVTEDGRTALNDTFMDRARLESELSVIAQRVPQPKVNVRGDKTTKYRHVSDVVNLAQAQGFKEVGFVSTRER